jgi:AcrR family transcriptional regulator
LIEAAIGEFAERGIDAASYNKIIERSGLSKGVVYYYFDDKESLLLTVLDDICERFMRAIGDLSIPGTKEEYWATAWEYHKRAILFFCENPVVSQVMFQLSQDERWAAAHHRATRFMDDLLARGQEMGAVRNDLPVETIQDLMHATGRVLATVILGKGDAERQKTDRSHIEKFMVTMHDLSKRMLAPEEVAEEIADV